MFSRLLLLGAFAAAITPTMAGNAPPSLRVDPRNNEGINDPCPNPPCGHYTIDLVVSIVPGDDWIAAGMFARVFENQFGVVSFSPFSGSLLPPIVPASGGLTPNQAFANMISGPRDFPNNTTPLDPIDIQLGVPRGHSSPTSIDALWFDQTADPGATFAIARLTFHQQGRTEPLTLQETDDPVGRVSLTVQTERVFQTQFEFDIYRLPEPSTAASLGLFALLARTRRR